MRGEFVNAVAELKYNEMLDMKKKVADQDKETPAHATVVKSILGHRSGYIKGMGHGVQVLRSRESNVFAGIDLKEKLFEQESKWIKMQQIILQHVPNIPPNLFS